MVQNVLIFATTVTALIVTLVVTVAMMKPCLPSGNGLTIGGVMLLAGRQQR